MTLQCLIGCVSGGGTPIQCVMQCGFNPQALQAGICVQNNCGAGVCF
jgi:hypothetical protein